VADLDTLYRLLPTLHRVRDAELGDPLRALLQVIEEQRQVVEDDLWDLYDSWFIETCPDWVIPYIGDLVGHRPARPIAPGERGHRRRSGYDRAAVGNLVRRRRAKGTPAALEGAARDAGGWPAVASESYPLLVVAQSVNHLRTERRGTVDVRDPVALERLDGPFDRGPWTAAAPQIDGRRSRSRWGLTSVALFAWRLRAQPLTVVPAFSLDRAGHRYMFSVLGNDTRLFSPAREAGFDASALDESEVPHPIGLRAFEARLPSFYGAGRSLRIFLGPDRTPVPVHAIVAADLSSWRYRPKPGHVAVDPVRGRIAFPARGGPQEGVWVTFHHGTVDDLGGGEYLRGVAQVGERARYAVGRGEPYSRLAEAVEAWQDEREQDPDKRDALIEITDGEDYTEPLEVRLRTGDRLEIRAAEGRRPVLRLLDYYSNRPDYLRVVGEADRRSASGPCPEPPAQILLDGLLMTGRGIEVTGEVGRVTVRHCTLVPGWSIDEQCRPQYEEEPSIELRSPEARLHVERSIVGTIVVDVPAREHDPSQVTVSDSVVDAANRGANAICAPSDRHAHADLEIRRSTVLGGVLAHRVTFAEDSIFADGVHVVRRQEGCIRYCYVPPGCRTPRRYRCQPELAMAAARAEARAAGVTDTDRIERLAQAAERRVRPQFDSDRYGTPAYCRLARTCAPEISQGAHDEAEMGVYHDLFQPQREDNVRAALDDFVPAGMAGGTYFAT
jgi:hypothetical protein